MDADSLALISARINASLSSATNASQALSDATNSAKQVQFFEARATSVTANTKGGFDILIQALNSGNSQTLMLNSKFPVPVNSLLLLKLEESITQTLTPAFKVETSTPKATPNEAPPKDSHDRALNKEANPASNLTPKGEHSVGSLESQKNQQLNKLLELSLISYKLPSAKNTSSAKASPQMQSVLSEWVSSRIPVLLRSNNQDAQRSQTHVQKTNTTTNPTSTPSEPKQTAFRQINNQTSASSMSSKVEALYQSSSNQTLPKMPSISQSLSALIANIQKLPEPAQAPLLNWVESLPPKLAINQGHTLKSQVQNSGQFFENKLTSQLLSLTTAQAQKIFKTSINSTANKQAPLTESLQPQKTSSDSPTSTKQTKATKEIPNPIVDKPSQTGVVINKDTALTTKNLSNSANLFQLLWGKLKPDQAPVPETKTALSSSSADELSPSVKQVLTSVKEKLEGLANLGFKQAAPNWATQLQQGDLKLALAQSLIKTLQFNMQQGLISGQDAQQAMAGRIPINISPNSLVNETQQLLQQTFAQLEVDQQQQINDDRPTHNAQLYFRDNQQLQQVQIELLETESDEQEEKGKKKVRQWRIRLHFELEKLGELGVEINLSPPRAAASFWSTQSHTLKALQSAIAPLRARLQHQGVDVSDLQVRHGTLPERSKNSIQQQLIDIHT